MSEGGLLWTKVIKGKYGEEGGWWSCEVRDPFGVGLWKVISKEWDLFNSKICYGDGKRVKFWRDRWCSQEPLKVLFPLFYLLYPGLIVNVINSE